MKILLINNCHYHRGGADVVYFETARLLFNAGHEVVFFSLADDNNLHTDKKEFFVPTSRGFSRITSYFSNNNAVNKLNEVLSHEHFDIAHAHLMWGGMTGAIIPILHRHGIPLVHTVHDYRMVCPAYTFRNGKGEICECCKKRWYIPCIVNRCTKGSFSKSVLMAMEMYYRSFRWNPSKVIDGIIYVSNFAKHKHENIDPGFKAVTNMVLYNCTQEKEYKEKKRGDYFLYYGRLSHEKGVETVIDAFKLLPGQKLKVVGTGPLEHQLRQKAVGVSQIEFLGYKQGDELYDLVSNAYFVIVPSQWYENNPMTIVEAYSFGTPVIGSDLGGIPEIIENGSTGFVYKHDAMDSLLSTIEMAVNISRDSYAQMIKRSYVFYRDNFSEKEYIKKLLAFYCKVLDQFRQSKIAFIK